MKSHPPKNKLKKFWAFVRSTVGPLKPLAQHAIKAISISLIVRIVSITLHFIAPTEAIHAIEALENLFYVAVSASLGIYSFVLFCWHLVLNFKVEAMTALREKDIELEKHLVELETHARTELLTEGNRNDHVTPQDSGRIQPEESKAREVRGNESSS